MKKTFIYALAAAVSFAACSDDDFQDPYAIPEVENIATQNANDDKAIEKFLQDNYLNSKGKITSFSGTTTADDNEIKLADMAMEKLPSGVIVIMRPGAQPDPGVAVGATDKLRLMQYTLSYLSVDESGLKLSSPYPFSNNVEGSGVPDSDPLYYYAPQSVLDGSKKSRSFYEIEGFQEGIRKFKSFTKSNAENYNLQGVIIVPSRAAFARDEHYSYGGLNWRNRTFIFNFQLYGSEPR